jgi:predicted PurR-regulated permease PerM
MAGNKQQERVFFFAVFALLAILTFLVIRPFLGAILLAIITVVLLRPLYVWLSKRKPVGLGPLRITFGPRLTTTLTI